MFVVWIWIWVLGILVESVVCLFVSFFFFFYFICDLGIAYGGTVNCLVWESDWISWWVVENVYCCRLNEIWVSDKVEYSSSLLDGLRTGQGEFLAIFNFIQLRVWKQYCNPFLPGKRKILFSWDQQSLPFCRWSIDVCFGSCWWNPTRWHTGKSQTLLV